MTRTPNQICTRARFTINIADLLLDRSGQNARLAGRSVMRDEQNVTASLIISGYQSDMSRNVSRALPSFGHGIRAFSHELFSATSR